MEKETKLKKYFPMIRTREEVMEKIKNKPDLLKMYSAWKEYEKEEFLNFCTGAKGVKMLYDSFFKEVMNPEYAPEGGEVYPNLATLMEQVTDSDNTYVVGGASVYQTMIDQCDKAYVTKIDAEYPADCWFPNLDDDPSWEIYEQSEEMDHEGLKYHYVNYRKK